MNPAIPVLVTVSGLALAAGCGRVEPGPDYATARSKVVEAAGVDSVYDPEQDAATPEQVDALLAHGLSQEEAVRVALLNNRELQAAFYEIGVARADAVQAGLLKNPTISGAFLFGDSSELDLGLSQNIAELWKLPLQKNAAAGDVDQAILKIVGLASKLTADVKTAYADALAADEYVLLVDDDLKLARDTSTLAQQAYDTGGAGEIDPGLARGDELRLGLAVEEARLARDAAYRRVAALLSLSGEPPLQLTDRLPEPTPLNVDAAQLLALAQQKRVDLKAASAAVAAAEARIKAEYVNMFPEFNLGVDISSEEVSDELTNAVESDARAAAAFDGSALSAGRARVESVDEDVLNIGPLISIELPIFDQNLAQIAKAKILRDQAIKLHEHLSGAVGHDVAAKHAAAATAIRSALFHRDQLLPQAQQNLINTRRSYPSGAGGALAMLDAQRTLIDVRRNTLAARRDAVVALGQLDLTVGAPVAPMAAEPDAKAPTAAPPTENPIPPAPLGVRIRALGALRP